MRTLQTVSYQIGDAVEVASNDEGFVGSYYEATMVGQLTTGNVYIVQYKNLMTDDFSAPLTENVPLAQIRPQPPHVQSTFFNMYQNLLAEILEVDIITVPDFLGDLTDPPTVIVEGVHYLVHVEKGGLHLRRLRPDLCEENVLRQWGGKVVRHQILVLNYVDITGGQLTHHRRLVVGSHEAFIVARHLHRIASLKKNKSNPKPGDDAICDRKRRPAFLCVAAEKVQTASHPARRYRRSAAVVCARTAVAFSLLRLTMVEADEKSVVAVVDDDRRPSLFFVVLAVFF
nr:DUF724 domain-containing protein 3 [Ipomoea trifida]